MNTTRRTLSATDRLISWLKSPFPAKLHSVLVRAIGVAKIFDGETFRRAYFDTLDPNRQFSVSTHGSEKYVVLNSDKAISRALFIKGSFDFDKVEKVISVMSAVNKAFKLETLIDVGANIGTVCIPAVKRGLAANAIAIEPEPLNYRVLVANIFLNDLADKIKTYNLALGSKDNQTLELELSAGHSGDHRIHVANETGTVSSGKITSVKSETFDSVVPAVDRNSCLVWMDTQGYEGFILQGAQNIIRAQVPMVVEFWPEGMKRMRSYSALREAMLNYGDYYDLSDEHPQPVPINQKSVDALYERLGETGQWTDVLLI
jgi:FkbM family methyltransferase